MASSRNHAEIENDGDASRSGSNSQRRWMPPQNENLTASCNCRGLSIVLGCPKVAFGEFGTVTGKSPKASQAGGAAAACSEAQDTDAAPL